jgi:hypothetical protein
MIIDLGAIGKFLASLGVCILIIAIFYMGFKGNSEMHGKGKGGSSNSSSNSGSSDNTPQQ